MTRRSQRWQTIGTAALAVLDALGCESLGLADPAALDMVADRAGVPPGPSRRRIILDALHRDPRFQQRRVRVVRDTQERSVRAFFRADQSEPAAAEPPLPAATLPTDVWRRRQFVAALLATDPHTVTPAQVNQVATHLAAALAQPSAIQRARIIALYGLAGAPHPYETLAAQEGCEVVTIRNSVRLGLAVMGRFLRAQTPPSRVPDATAATPLPGDVLFWERVDRSGVCWLWTGALDHGCPVFKRGRTKQLATRYVYALCIGPIPAGRRIVRTCGEARCVRPDHLAAATPGEILGAPLDAG